MWKTVLRRFTNEQFNKLIFNEENHKYFLFDFPETPLISVTQLIARYSHKFNVDQEATKYATQYSLNADEIKKTWNDKTALAASIGSEVHKVAESISLRIASKNILEIKKAAGFEAAILKFFSDFPGLYTGWLLPEVKVVHPYFLVAGTIDLVCNFQGLPSIIDWKTSEKMDYFGFNSKKMYRPLHSLPDSNYWHYVCQLNLYKRICEEIYDYPVHLMKIVWLAKDGVYKLLNVPDISDKIDLLLHNFWKQRAKEMAKGSWSRVKHHEIYGKTLDKIIRAEKIKIKKTKKQTQEQRKVRNA